MPILYVIRFIKLIISIFVYYADRMRYWFHRMIGKVPSGACTVILYHIVAGDQVQRYQRQMEQLIRIARPIPADFKAPLEKGIHHVAITFDDGYYCTLSNILPIMSQLHIPFTIFIPTGYLGQVPGWKNMDKNFRYFEPIISRQQLIELKDHDWISFGAHSVTHADFMQLDAEQFLTELTRSKRDLEKILHKSITLFSFPYGVFNRNLFFYLRQSGFQRVFTAQSGQSSQNDGEFLVDRVEVEPTDWWCEFKYKALGGYRWLPMLSKLKMRLYRHPGKFAQATVMLKKLSPYHL